MNKPRLIRSSDLALVGGDPRSLAKLSNSGRLTRIRQGIYVDSSEWVSLSRPTQYGLRAEAFRCLTSVEPIFCYATAALVWGLWIVGIPTALHVRTLATAGGRNRNGVVRHIGSGSDGAVRCGQLLISDKLTTTMQLINKLPFPYAVAVCDSSLRPMDSRRQVNHFVPPGCESFGEAVWVTDCPQGPPLHLDDLRAAAMALPSQAARTRTLAVINFASALSGSAGESISRAKMYQMRFPAPVLQKEFTLRDGCAAFVDFWFKEQKLAGEFDGKAKYMRSDWSGGSMEDRLWNEKRREDDIRAQGVRFVRWTWQDINDSNRFERLLRQAGLPQINSRQQK